VLHVCWQREDASILNLVIAIIIALVATLFCLVLASICAAIVYTSTMFNIVKIIRSDYADMWRDFGSPDPWHPSPWRGFKGMLDSMALAREAPRRIPDDARIVGLSSRRRSAFAILMKLLGVYIVVFAIAVVIAVLWGEKEG